jgi:FkbM family methyltransferase
VSDDATSDDAFLGGQLQILQPANGYRAGLDAVLLAAAAPVERIADGGTVRVLDAGSGVGVVGLCLARRIARVHVTLVERDPVLADLARRNVERNNLADRVRVVEADVGAPLKTSAELSAAAGSFDLALANPPYHDAAAGTSARDELKAQSHAMPAGSLERWLRFLAAMVRPQGEMALIHRAEALGEILQACERRFGGLRVRPLHPRVGAPANRVLVEGTKGSRAPLKIAAGLVLHGPEGRFTENVEAVLRHGKGLEFSARS